MKQNRILPRLFSTFQQALPLNGTHYMAVCCTFSPQHVPALLRSGRLFRATAGSQWANTSFSLFIKHPVLQCHMTSSLLPFISVSFDQHITSSNVCFLGFSVLFPAMATLVANRAMDVNGLAAAARTHTQAVTRNYISQPRLSMQQLLLQANTAVRTLHFRHLSSYTVNKYTYFVNIAPKAVVVFNVLKSTTVFKGKLKLLKGNLHQIIPTYLHFRNTLHLVSSQR